MKRTLCVLALAAALPLAFACRSTRSESPEGAWMQPAAEASCCGTCPAEAKAGECAAGASCAKEKASTCTESPGVQNAFVPPSGSCAGEAKSECSKKASSCEKAKSCSGTPQN